MNPVLSRPNFVDFLQDKEEYVKERVKKLVEAGMISAMIALSKTESQNTREQVCR